LLLCFCSPDSCSTLPFFPSFPPLICSFVAAE
jgi:hypothetical protein